MRAAPAVDLPLASGRWERVVVVLLHAVAGAALGAWLSGWLPGWSQRTGPFSDPSIWMGLMACVFALVGLWQALRVLPSAPRVLRWSGEAWLLGSGLSRLGNHGAAAATACEPALRWQDLSALQLQLDLGGWLLLWCRPCQGPTAWAVASRGQAGPTWHPMAVALRAHAGPGLRILNSLFGQAAVR